MAVGQWRRRAWVDASFEAASAVLDHLRTDPTYPQLYAAVLPDNTASMRLLIKLGFHFERSENFEHREKLLYSIDIA